NFFFSLWHLCCSEVSISPLFRWPNSVNHFMLGKKEQQMGAKETKNNFICIAQKIITQGCY
ncbi:hypothetical protein, partial [Escherichia coli]|uniref:hypothetical protein n=1 Tax=Escherichia coli TaxID=562 RepID=UPI001C835C83